MWTFEKQSLRDDIARFIIKDDRSSLSISTAIDLWRGDDDAFRQFFVELLKSAPFGSFRFETPPAATSTIDRPFEFVLIDSPEIDLDPDPWDFNEHFDNSPEDVLTFRNLGGDATMIVPRPREGAPGYAHIAAFLRCTPVAQQLQLWRTVGHAMHRLIGEAPLWLNTAGGGVPWLHVRIDTRPKYYVFGEYENPPDR
jgi:hypothetical protein